MSGSHPPPTAARDLATSIYEVGLRASLAGRLQDVIRQIARRVLEATEASYVGIALVQPTRQTVVHTWGAAADDSEVLEGRSQPLGRGVVGQAATTGRTVVVDEVAECSDYLEGQVKTRSVAAIPLKRDDVVTGVLNVESSAPAHFDAPRLALLETIAAPIALSLEAARLFHETRRRLDQLALLNHVSRIITSTVDLEQLMGRTVQTIRRQLGYTMVAVGLVDEASGQVVLRAADAGVPIALPIGHRQPIGEGVTGRVILSGESVLLSDVSSRPDYVAPAETIQCEMCCPLKSKSGIIGFLDASSEQLDAFDEHDLMLLETIADHICQAIENAWTLQQITELRDDLSSMVVHDLRNPLTVVTSALEMLSQAHRRMTAAATEADAGPASQAAGRYVAEAQGACEEMLVLIAGLLDLQKLEAGELSLSTQRCGVTDLVGRVVGRMQLIAQARKLELCADLAEGLPHALLDVGVISRVVENLTINTLKYTPKQGSVSIQVGRAPQEVIDEHRPKWPEAILLQVRDTGPGIPASDRKRIFDKYAVVELRRSQPAHSSGLGLAFCRQAVRAHGGTIWVTDNTPAGSAFHVLLPTEACIRFG